MKINIAKYFVQWIIRSINNFVGESGYKKIFYAKILVMNILLHENFQIYSITFSLLQCSSTTLLSTSAGFLFFPFRATWSVWQYVLYFTYMSSLHHQVIDQTAGLNVYNIRYKAFLNCFLQILTSLWPSCSDTSPSTWGSPTASQPLLSYPWKCI